MDDQMMFATMIALVAMLLVILAEEFIASVAITYNFLTGKSVANEEFLESRRNKWAKVYLNDTQTGS